MHQARASKIKSLALSNTENEHRAKYLRRNKGLFKYFAALMITATSLVSVAPQDAYVLAAYIIPISVIFHHH